MEIKAVNGFGRFRIKVKGSYEFTYVNNNGLSSIKTASSVEQESLHEIYMKLKAFMGSTIDDREKRFPELVKKARSAADIPELVAML